MIKKHEVILSNRHSLEDNCKLLKWLESGRYNRDGKESPKSPIYFKVNDLLMDLIIKLIDEGGRVRQIKKPLESNNKPK